VLRPGAGAAGSPPAMIAGHFGLASRRAGDLGRRASLSPLMVVAHGLLAMSTMALVLFAALGTAAL